MALVEARFQIRIEGRIDAAASIEMFRRSGDDLLDRWHGHTFVRTILSGRRPLAYAMSFERRSGRLEIKVTVEDSRYADEVANTVRRTFVQPKADYARLLADDPVIARLEATHPGTRPVRQSNLMNALVRCITTQQVNLRWAATCRRRIAEAFGRVHQVGGHTVYSLEPERIAQLTIAEIRALQLTERKAEYIINVARAITDRQLSISLLEEMDDDEVIARLTALRGIGLWTAEWILARTLGRPRVVAGDLGVRKAVGIAYCGGAMPAAEDVRRITANWGESAAVAQALLLHALAEKTIAGAAIDAGGAAAPPASQ